MNKIQHKQCSTNYEQKEMACKELNEIEFWTLREKNDMQNLMCCWKGRATKNFIITSWAISSKSKAILQV